MMEREQTVEEQLSDAFRILDKAGNEPPRDGDEMPTHGPGLAGSLTPSPAANVNAAWKDELARRADDVRSGQVKTAPWTEVQRKARSVLDGRVQADI